jgi:hypothetical protein
MLDFEDPVCNNTLNTNKDATIGFLCYNSSILGNMRFSSSSLKEILLFSGDTHLSYKMYDRCKYEVTQLSLPC